MSKMAEIAAKVITKLLANPNDLPCCPDQFGLEQFKNCSEVCRSGELNCEDCWREALSKGGEMMGTPFTYVVELEKENEKLKAQLTEATRTAVADLYFNISTKGKEMIVDDFCPSDFEMADREKCQKRFMDTPTCKVCWDRATQCVNQPTVAEVVTGREE